MAVKYSTSAILSATSIENIPAESIRRLRYSSSEVSAKSQINLDPTEFLTRVHHVEGFKNVNILTKAGLTAKAKRIRKTSSKIDVESKLFLENLLVLPLPPEPIGSLSLNGKALNRQRLKQGVINNFILKIQFSKIESMEIEFEASLLDDTVKILKRLKGEPGGIYEESLTNIPDATNNQKIQICTIPILKSDSEIEGEELELRYKLKMFNNLINLSYLIDSGTFTIY